VAEESFALESRSIGFKLYRYTVITSHNNIVGKSYAEA
jgi:hypothetical protein